MKELHATIKEEARKLEAATAALQEETKKLRVMELEADELRDKYVHQANLQCSQASSWRGNG